MFKNLLSNAFNNPRTTLAGALGVAVAAAASSVIPALVSYFSGASGPGWQVLAFGLGLLPGLLMKDKKPEVKP